MRALITANFSEYGLDLLKRHADVIYKPWGKTGNLLMAEDLADEVGSVKADLLIVEVDLVHEEVFEARKLMAVGCCRANPLNVDLETAIELGVPVFSTPGRNAHAVADLTLGYMLCLARGIVGAHNELVSGRYDPSDVKELMVKLEAMSGFEIGTAQIGVVGFGAIGREVAKRLRAFGSRVVVHDPHVDSKTFEKAGVAHVSLDKLFRESDIVTLHCADTPETKGMVTGELIDCMKSTAYFINTARHRLVDADALYNALGNQRIAGAALDVFKCEPPTKDDPFLRLDNVIATPHIGGATRDVIEHQSRMIAEDIDLLLRGEIPHNCINPEVLAR